MKNRVDIIRFRIVPTGAWKSDRIAREFGRYTYPILITQIKAENGLYVEVPLGYETHLASLIKAHIWREKVVDWDYIRRADQHRVRDKLIKVMDEAINTPAEKIREWYNAALKEGVTINGSISE